MKWESINWTAFTKALSQYRDKFYLGRTPEEKYYIEIIIDILNEDIKNKKKYVPSILLFLNRWHCRFSNKTSLISLTNWIEREYCNLDSLSDLTIYSSDIVNNLEIIDKLYNSLIDLKNFGIHNMSDACASKILHFMLPSIFVMWDKNIKQNIVKYSDFILTMHSFSILIIKEYNKLENKIDIENFLKKYLDYPIKKSLAKYIDEYNWYLFVGKDRC